MAGPQVTTANFASPISLIAPDLAVQQQQIARNQALAQQLRQSSLADIPGNGGRVSWTQGAAKLADALLARSMQKKSDAQQVGLAQQYAGALRGMFGAGGAAAIPRDPGMSMPGGSSSDPAAPPATPSPDPASLAAGLRQAGGLPDGRGTYGSGGVEDDGSGSLPPPSSASAPAPAGAPAAMVSTPSPSPQVMAPQTAPQGAPQPQQQPQAMGPMSLTGNPQQDMMMYSLNPDEYTKAMIAARAPVDIAKMVSQARDAMSRGDMATASALLAQVDKLNYLAPINGRPGSTIRDPHDPSHILAMDPQNIEGGNPVLDANGRWTGAYQTAPGAADAAGAMAAAKARGGAAGSVTQVFDPSTNSMVYRPTSTLLPGGAPQPSGGGNSLNTLFGGAPAGAGGAPGAPGGPAGGGNAAGPPLGAAPGASTDAQNSANQFNAVISGAQGSQDRAFGLQKIGDLAKGLPTGEGAVAINDAKSGVNSVLGAMGAGPFFSNDQVSKVQEIQKLASSLAQQQSSSLGGNGATDAKLSAAFASLPDAHKAPQAIADITTYLSANEKAIQGKAAAASAWKATHGPTSYSDFSAAWQRAYDPRIFQWMQQGPAVVRHGLATLPPAERQQLIAKSNMLAQMGALGQ